MAFFEIAPSKGRSKATVPYSVEFLHKSECGACPLNNSHGLKHPNMLATGSKKPVVYVLGEAPGENEDRQGEQFVGESGQLLRDKVPDQWLNKIRWNNCVRTRPPGNKTPGTIEIECCRPSVVRDIEASKPKAVFGFGNVPLKWATGLTGISFWRGRRMPIKVGNHTCWFFPMYHPAYLLRTASDRDTDGYGSEEEFAFELDLNRAFEFMADAPDPVVHSPDQAMQDLRVLQGGTDSDLKKILKFLDRYADYEGHLGFDYETSTLRPYTEGSKVLSVALSVPKYTLAFPFRHKEATWSKKQLKTLESAFTEFLVESRCLKVVHNLQFELEWTVMIFGEEALRNGRWGCSFSQGYILDERYGSGVLGLDGLCIQYFGLPLKSLNKINRADLDNVPLAKVLPYNALDAKYHRLLFAVQEPQIVAQGLEDQYYHNVERMAALSLTQVKGMPVDGERAATFDRKYTKIVQKLDRSIDGLSSVKTFRKRKHRAFNAGSNDDVKFLVNKILGYGVGSVNEENLATVDNPVAKLVLDRRKAAKLQSTYISSALPGSPVLFGDKFHPVFGTCSTRTWRTSSDSPNAQNWPKYEGREIREIVCPGGDYVVVAFDYAGIQARNVAMESKDKTLVKYFKERYDIHTDWMERIARRHPKWIKEGVKKLSDKSVSKHYRQQSKNKLVFPLFFGAGAHTTSTGLGIPIEVSYDLAEEFKHEFPGIAKWHKELRKFYRKHGYVTGLSGFRRRAPVAPTEIINTPIQSDEAIIVLDALIRLSDLGEYRFQANWEIHDDLTFIWHKKEVDKNAEVVIGMMLDVPYEWAKIVPMGVEMSVGKDWANLESVGEYFSDEWNGRL